MAVFIVATSARSIARERRVEHAVPALRGRASCSRQHGQALGLGGDLLGVDAVVLDPGAGVGLVVAGAVERGLLVADLDLEALARAGLLGDRPEGLERAGLLLDLEGRRVAQRRQRLARLLADEPVELGGQLVHPRDVRVLACEQVLGGREVVEAERAELLLRVGLAPGVSSASISERPRSRRSISTSRSCSCIRVAAGAATTRRRSG